MNARSIRVSVKLLYATTFAAVALLGGGCQPQGTSGATVEAVAQPRPKAVVTEPNFNFGTMQRHEVREHRFAIRNDGDADLELKLGETSCKCTSAELTKPRLAPGETSEVVVQWRSEDAREYLRQGLYVLTNDLKNPRLALTVEGFVRVSLGAWPDAVLFPELDRDTEAEPVTVTLYSQLHSDVKITAVECDDPNLSLTLGRPDMSLPAPPKATFARPLTVGYRSGKKPGSFLGTIRVAFEEPTEADKFEQHVVEFPFSGSVVGDVSIFGRGVIGKALVMGMIPQSTGKKQTVYIHVKNRNGAEIRVGRIQPEFLRVRPGSPQKLSETLTRFPIEVEVPPGSPEINLENVNLGEVELRTTHPDYPIIKFQVSLAVAR